jgi:RNA polymerase sigma factor (sigma-70 family)
MDPAAPVPIERLLEHRAWVRTLARALVSDANRADDVEQDAWLAAMTRPPRHAAGLKTWLARLVRHRASNARRAETRRASHERTVFESTHDADSTDAVARIEELERVVRAVLALDEPYRSTVVMRFYEDLDAHAIAERTGAPVETVRTRLKRALAQLRGRLDDDHGGDGRSWRAALLPLAGAKSALVKGGLVVTAKAKVSLAVAAALILALTFSVAVLGGREEPPPIVVADAPAPIAPPVVVEPPPPPPAPTPAPVAVQPAVAAAPVVATPPVEKPPTPKPKPAPAVAEPVGTGAVFGAVRYATTRASVAGQKVALEAVGAATLTVSTDPRGGFRFEHLAESRSWRVRVEAANYAPVVVPNLHLDRDETRDVGTLWLDAPARLEIVVRDWRDRPIAGATVEVHRQRNVGVSHAFTEAGELRYVTEPVATATTGADGRAVLSALPRGDWTVFARAAGFASAFEWSATVAPGAAKREVTMHLDKALRIEGRVVGGDRKPVARAAVWAYAGNLVSTASAALPCATTDDAGRFVLDGLRPGETILRVGREGATPCAIEPVRVPASAPVEIVLDGGFVEGVVTDATGGRPLAGARVLAYMGHVNGVSIAEATSGEDGRYRLDTVRAGRPQWFRVERAGFATLDETPTNVMSRPEIRYGDVSTTRDFAMRRGVPLAGLVTSPDGPIAGARVVAWWYDRSDNGKWIVSTEGFTDGDGRFALTAAGSKTVVVQVFADGWYQEGLADFNWSSALAAGRKPPHAIDVPSRGMPDVNITMTRACAVAGRVESAAGKPVAGASVRCVWSTTTTADDGTFALTAAVTADSTEISAWTGRVGTLPQRVALSPGGRVDDVVLRLPRTVRVGGRVTTSSGAAIDGASVELIFRPTTPQWGQREWTGARVPVGEGGRYEAEFVDQEGGFHVRATAPGFASADSPQTTIETGRATYQADLVLAPSQVLEGRVISSADGITPVVGARIALAPSEDDRLVKKVRRQTLAAATDDDGRFRILDVAAGDAFLDVDADGFVQATTPVKVPTLPGLVLKVDPSFEIAGVVKLPGDATVGDVWDGGVVSGIWVGLRLENDREHRYWSTAVGVDGRFRLNRLPCGTYTASVSVRGGTVSVRPFETKGVTAGKTDVEFVLSAAGQIAGRVLAPDGRPLGGCGVQAFSETGDPYTPSDTTKDDGTFVIRGVTAGTYRLDAKPPEASRTGYVTQGAQLRAAKATGVAVGAKDVEIRLTGGLTIRGVFLDAAGKPLADAWVRAEIRPGQDVESGVDSWFLGPGAQTDAAGRFTISGLATARYRLVHVPDPQNVVVARPLKGGDDVVAGATNVRVVAGNLATISGTVVDEDGKPIADASVDLIAVGCRPAASVRTDANGVFTIRDASDVGRYVMKASKFERVPAQIDDVAAGAAGVSIRLVRGREASGRVLQRDGTPFADGRVSLVLEGGDYRVSAPTDADGRFTAKALKDGVYRVESSPTVIRSGEKATTRACGTIKAGEKDVELRMTE